MNRFRGKDVEIFQFRMQDFVKASSTPKSAATTQKKAANQVTPALSPKECYLKRRQADFALENALCQLSE